ncbi:MAG: ATP-binding cassette domain-containing protein, partial [Lachnospiraceae bacterium]|nr:ATP-binding cassette domain-containing protein [Lachnospiraceae bacterium]
MLLQIQDGSLSAGSQTILSHFHMEIRGNEKIALVGRNGSGKTTLLRLLAGELSLDRNDKNPDSGILTSRKLTTGLLRQQTFSNASLTVEQELLKACPCPDKWDKDRFAW